MRLMGDQTVTYFNSENADQESGNSRLNRHHLKTTRVTAMIKVSRQTIQLPPRFREQLYKKLSMEASAESLSKPWHPSQDC